MSMNAISGWIQARIGLGLATQHRLLVSIIFVLVLWIIHGIIARLLLPRIEDIQVRYRTRKLTGYAIFIIGILVIGRIWLGGFHTFGTYLGIVSAGLAIALRDPIVNLVGWVFIMLRQPFSVGDRIQIGAHAGDVIDLRVFQFTLMEIGNWVDADQSTGRIIHIPNGRVFTEALANYSKGFQYIWNEIPVLVTFESNWQKAKEIMLRIVMEDSEKLSKQAAVKVRDAARKFMIFYAKLTPIVYTSVKDSGILLTVRYLCEPRERRATAEAIWEDILKEFAKCDDIDFAYPTRRFYDNLAEGKPGTTPSPPDPGGPPA
ncbi:MAG: mechanosensitive ion channel domain-containing protein [Candidatus Eisenbacteria bacterium]